MIKIITNNQTIEQDKNTVTTFTCRAQVILRQRLEMRIGKMYKW